jgi:hypothetical protein
MAVETPRDIPTLQTWTSPLLGTLQSRDARSLQAIFSSLTDYLKNIQTTISSNYYNLSIGSISQGAVSASITGTFPSQVLNLTLPVGPTGPTGATGPTGPAGTPGYSILNIDGGHPDTVYGGINPIDCGSL